jgi:hypothetical protein
LYANATSVGVGTTNIYTIFNVTGNTAYSGISNSVAFFHASNSTAIDSGILLGSITGNTPFIAATNLNGGSGSATALTFLTNNTERMRIDSSGNVGIGTSSPSTKTVIQLSGSSNSYLNPLRLVNTSGGSSGCEIQFAGTYSGSAPDYAFTAGSVGGLTTNGSSNGSGALIFKTQLNGTLSEVMRIDSSGNVLIGASSFSPPIYDNTYLYVNGNLWINNTSPGSSSYYFRFDGYNNSLYALWNGGSSDVGVKLDYGATSWASASDEESKDIIEPINNAVQKILTLRTVIGKYKTDEIGTRRPFLIAQDVKAVLPEAVSESIAPNQTKSNLWLSYQETIPLIIAGIKELSAQVTQLQSQVAALTPAKV